LGFGLEPGQALPGRLDSRFELRSFQQPILVCIDEASDSSLDSGKNGCQRTSGLGLMVVLPFVHAALIFRSIRSGSLHNARTSSYRRLHEISSDLAIVADSLSPKAVSMHPDAGGTHNRAFAFTCGPAHRLAVEA
jgi:hypothetical protein